MKNLKVEYNGVVLFDGEVDEVIWNDGPSGVAVTGKFARVANAGSGVAGGLMEFLTAASKKQTEAKIEEKKSALAAEADSQENATV